MSDVFFEVGCLFLWFCECVYECEEVEADVVVAVVCYFVGLEVSAVEAFCVKVVKSSSCACAGEIAKDGAVA